jgi:transcriptional regulator with XRE-family HTH domain
MSKRSIQPIVAPAPAEQRIGKPEVSSGGRGKPLDSLIARLEAKHPGIEKEIGVSSAALRAGRQVREMRLAKGWTQVQLAKKLGWDQVRVSNIERGEGTLGPTFDVLQKIAAVCEYDIDFKPRREKSQRSGEFLRGIAQTLAHVEPVVGTIVTGPQFADACIAFAGSVGTAVQTHFRMVEEPPAGPKAAKGVMGDIPYVEMAAQGKRMVMLPVLVEDSDVEVDAGAEVEMTLTYPHR